MFGRKKRNCVILISYMLNNCMHICINGSLREEFPQHPWVETALVSAAAGLMPSEDLVSASGTYLDFKHTALGNTKELKAHHPLKFRFHTLFEPFLSFSFCESCHTLRTLEAAVVLG